MNYRVAVLGPGSWGTALAQVLAENGHDVRIWGHRASSRRNQHPTHESTLFTRSLSTRFHPSIHQYGRCSKRRRCGAIRHSNESNTFCCKELVPKLNTKPVIIHASKGLEQGTHKRISDILLEEIPAEKKAVVVLSGPSHAEEVAKHDITTITAASTDAKQQNMYKSCS